MYTSRSVGYGLVAITYVAQHQKEGLVLSNTISKKYKIPLAYLLKIMQNLVKARILRSKRGPSGGFQLSKSLNQISMLQIIEAIDGPTVFSLGLEDVQRDKFTTKAEKAFGAAMQKSTKALRETKISTLVS